MIGSKIYTQDNVSLLSLWFRLGKQTWRAARTKSTSKISKANKKERHDASTSN